MLTFIISKRDIYRYFINNENLIDIDRDTVLLFHALFYLRSWDGMIQLLAIIQ